MKKFFPKRILSILIVATFLISFATQLLTNAEAGEVGYISNADFEEKTASWNLNNGSSIVEEGRGGSGYAIKVKGSQWSNVNQRIKVEANTDYSLTGWVKRVRGEGAHYLYAKSSDGGSFTELNGTKKWFTYMSDDWVMHRWEFNSGDNTELILYMMIEDADSVFLYDDIKLEKLNPESFDGYIYNGDFEIGMSPGVWQLNDSYSIVEGGYDGSGYALYVEGKEWTNANQTVTVETNTDYRMSVWVKRIKGTGAHRFCAKADGETVTALNDSKEWFDYTDSDWVKHTWEFNSGNNTQVTVYITVDDANSVFMYDNVSMEKLAVASYDGYITNGDFETGRTSGWIISDTTTSSVVSGGYNSSSYSLRLGGTKGTNVKQTLRVEGMTDYRLKFNVRRVSGKGKQTVTVEKEKEVIEAVNGTKSEISNSTPGWFEHVYEFNSGRTTVITICLKIASGTSTYIYDNIILEEIKKPDYSDVLKGDISLDGKIDSADAELISKHINGTAILEGAAEYAADADYDGAITRADVTLVNKLMKSVESEAVLLSPIAGKVVAHPSWQVVELLDRYVPGKSDDFSGISNRVDSYMRDPIVLHWAFLGSAERFEVLVADNRELAGARSYYADEPILSIDNLIPDKTYYWAVIVNGKTSAVSSFKTANTIGTVTVEGVSNTRDLGGWSVGNGMRVKYGLAYRGANLDTPSEKGKSALLVDIGLKTEVDLRNHGEGLKYTLGDSVNFLLAGQWGGAMYASEDNTSITRLDSHYVAATANAIRAFADESNYPIYFHCSYGRDRTGTMALLLLGLLGVDRSDIMKDFELSFLAEFSGGGIAAAGHIKTMNQTIDWLKRTYAPSGSLQEAVEGYLLDIGITPEEISSIRRIMLEEIPEDIIKGDLDDDGEITVSDALAALRIAAKLAESNEDILKIGDVDADGEITVSDALAILRVAAKMADIL